MNIEMGIVKYGETYPLMTETALSIANGFAITGKYEALTPEELEDHQLYWLMAAYLEDHDENIIPGKLIASFVRCRGFMANNLHHEIVNFLRNDKTFLDTLEAILKAAWKEATKEIN